VVRFSALVIVKLKDPATTRQPRWLGLSPKRAQEEGSQVGDDKAPARLSEIGFAGDG
jgi:hypothetical protein